MFTLNPPTKTNYVPPQNRPTVTDDYERWYTESAPNNRMLLALRSGIDDEISWALDRLCRLCHNEQFLLSAIPGLTDALFVWPDWYVASGINETPPSAHLLFALPKHQDIQRRHAIESMFILRNASVNAPNAQELTNHRRTRSLILLALHRIGPDTDMNTEFLVYVIELLHSISASGALHMPPVDAPILATPLPPLQILAASSDRSLAIASLNTLSLIFSTPHNAIHLSPYASALDASLRYLPLLTDRPLVDAAVNYLYVHLSHPAMTKAFLLHPRLSGILKLLVTILLVEQTEENVEIAIGQPPAVVPKEPPTIVDHTLTEQEMASLLQLPEPNRCYEWMKLTFVSSPEGELTQVDFWTLYQTTFYPHSAICPLLVASEVIKNVNLVFPTAQAMVLPGPPQRFVVRGVDRRKDTIEVDRFKCLWGTLAEPCMLATSRLSSTSELFDHILEHHIDHEDTEQLHCNWAGCSHGPLPKRSLRGHILTHLPSMQPQPKHPDQPETITLPAPGYPHPIPNPTQRPPPPASHITLKFKRPTSNPPSTSLTALLCIRLLFRASFASADAAPRVDDEHFGFPGVVEEIGEKEGDEEQVEDTRDLEGERRGRKALVGVRYLLEGIRIMDDTLMGWILEMIDVTMSGSTTS